MCNPPKDGSLHELPLPGQGTLILSAHPASLPGASVAQALEGYRQLGATLVLSLITVPEMLELGLGALAETCAAQNLQWWHAPIADRQAPDPAFDRWWHAHAPALHALLDTGGGVALHCWGGRGRTGTIAARILLERGLPVGEAIRQVRACRPGAIETEAQERYLLGLPVTGSGVRGGHRGD